MTEPQNRLSATIETRYRLTRFLFLGFVPLVIAAIAVGSALSSVGVWIGSEDHLGRILLYSTAAVAVAGRFSHRARAALNFFIIAAFGGRAFGFLLVAPPGLSVANRLGAAMSWAAITMACLLLDLQMDTLIRFRDERRRAGLE